MYIRPQISHRETGRLPSLSSCQREKIHTIRGALGPIPKEDNRGAITHRNCLQPNPVDLSRVTHHDCGSVIYRFGAVSCETKLGSYFVYFWFFFSKKYSVREFSEACKPSGRINVGPRTREIDLWGRSKILMFGNFGKKYLFFFQLYDW